MAVIVAGWYRQHMPSGYRQVFRTACARTVHIQDGVFMFLPKPADKPSVLSMTNLLREAITRAAAWQGVELNASQKRLAGVILDEIGSLPRVNLGLPMPQDSRLLRIAQALSANPDDGRRLEEWAAWAGMSSRTLTRRFRAETGFSFNEWRQRIRLLRALELLAAGKPVTAIALDLGYDNVSAFIALFRRMFGTTPGRYKI